LMHKPTCVRLKISYHNKRNYLALAGLCGDGWWHGRPKTCDEG
jgi:hypothetical protein